MCLKDTIHAHRAIHETIGFNFEIVVDYDQLHLENEAGQPLLGAIGTHNASSYFVRVASYRFG